MKHFLEKETIEAELAKVVEEEAHGQVRANLFTLVIVCPLDGKAACAPMLDSLLGSRPSRIIRIYTGGSGDTSVDVSARCRLSDGRKSACFEEISIVNGSDNIGLDPRSWAPLLAADVPSCLFWLERTLDLPEPLVRGRELTDKLLVDTTAQAGLGEDLLDVYSALSCVPEEYVDGECGSHDGKSFVFSDFSWHETSDLRLITSDVFDPAGRRPLLGSIRSVYFESAEKPHATLYFVWLAARLGWRNPVRGADSLSFTDTSGKTVRCSYGRSPNTDSSIGFEFDGGKSCMLELADGECVCSMEPEAETETLLHAGADKGSILLAETGAFVVDSLFNEVVAYASGIPRHSQADFA